MSDRDFTPDDPVYEPDVHPEVARECLETWRGGRPWTRIRVLEKGTDNPSGHACANSQGHFNEPCDRQIEAVQYSSAMAIPQFYCEEHALKQNDWDIILHWSGPPQSSVDDERAGESGGIRDGETVGDFVKRGKRDQEDEPEQEENEP